MLIIAIASIRIMLQMLWNRSCSEKYHARTILTHRDVGNIYRSGWHISLLHITNCVLHHIAHVVRLHRLAGHHIDVRHRVHIAALHACSYCVRIHSGRRHIDLLHGIHPHIGHHVGHLVANALNVSHLHWLRLIGSLLENRSEVAMNFARKTRGQSGRFPEISNLRASNSVEHSGWRFRRPSPSDCSDSSFVASDYGFLGWPNSVAH